MAVLAHDAEEAEEVILLPVRGDEGAAALVPDHDAFGHQLVDGLAQCADRNAEALDQLALGRNRFARLPLALRQRGENGLLDVLVQDAADRTACIKSGTHLEILVGGPRSRLHGRFI
ncbi:hypothetical protein D3C72_1717570 [compost metagenome]